MNENHIHQLWGLKANNISNNKRVSKDELTITRYISNNKRVTKEELAIAR